MRAPSVQESSQPGMRAPGRWFWPTMSRPHLWTSLLLALLMVVVAPLCSYAALAQVQTQAQSSGLPNEEHREHEHRTEVTAQAPFEARPLPAARRELHTSYKRTSVPPVRLVDLHIPHPSRFSVRRLI